MRTRSKAKICLDDKSRLITVPLVTCKLLMKMGQIKLKRCDEGVTIAKPVHEAEKCMKIKDDNDFGNNVVDSIQVGVGGGNTPASETKLVDLQQSLENASKKRSTPRTRQLRLTRWNTVSKTRNQKSIKFECTNKSSNDIPQFTTDCMKSSPAKLEIMSHSRISSLVLWGTHHGLVNKSTKPRQFKCDLCNKPFLSKSAVLMHLQRHTGERPFKCYVCSKAFMLESEVTVHLRTHTGERPYGCSTCGRTFIQKSHLKQHERLHSGEKPYKCPQCGRKFRQHEHLHSHQMRQHRADLPHRCLHCNKSFVHACHLKSHIKIHL